MKTVINCQWIIVVVIITVFSAKTHAQWSTSGSNIYYNTGNVGIGTNTPRTKLDLGNSGGAMVVLNSGTAPGVNYTGFFHNDMIIGNWSNNGLSNGFISTGYKDNPLRKFHIGTASSETFATATFIPHFTVTAGGNIGIGTQDPEQLLQVHGSNNPGLAIGRNNEVTNGKSTLYFYAGTSTNKNGFKVEYNKASGTDRLAFIGGSGEEILTVRNDGSNVGIGISDPAHRLDIRDVKPGAAARLRLWNNTTNTAATESRIDLPVFNGSSGLSIRSMGTSAAGGFNVGVYDAWMHTGQTGSYLHLSAGDAQNHAAKHLTIKSDGFVGIGTTNPDQKLTVNGTIHTKEVLVDVNIQAGPDYVFEKDYDLLPLAELEAYINQNKHLPEVPSAKEMAADGLKLMEMNLLLLKKVEELTLHMIELKKENVRQQSELDALKK